jgi:hypothetical protein
MIIMITIMLMLSLSRVVAVVVANDRRRHGCAPRHTV